MFDPGKHLYGGLIFMSNTSQLLTSLLLHFLPSPKIIRLACQGPMLLLIEQHVLDANTGK
jgi:hypothetical protein